MELDQSDQPRNVPGRSPLPIEIAKWWKNRRRNESVHVTLSEYEGRSLINIRVYATGADGIDRPTAKGIAMAIGKLPTLAAALAKAEVKARSLGLIQCETAGEGEGAK